MCGTECSKIALFSANTLAFYGIRLMNAPIIKHFLVEFYFTVNALTCYSALTKESSGQYKVSILGEVRFRVGI